MTESQQPTGYRYAFLRFAPGISRRNAWTFLYLNFLIMPIVSFLSFSQPYVLNEIVGIPADQQGRITGFLITMQELVALALVGYAGALSDRFGRRSLYAIGVFVCGIGFLLYGHASNETDLYIYRFVYAVGVAVTGVMIAVTAADYPVEEARGKLTAVTGVLNGLGVGLTTALVAGLPALFVSQGFGAAKAGQFMLYAMAAVAFTTAIIMQWGLKGGTPGNIRSRSVNPLRSLAIGVQQGVANRRLLVCYAGSFISRADLTLVANFVSLFLQQAGKDQGLTATEAIQRAGLLFAIVQTASLFTAPVAGFCIDRYHRLLCVVVSLFVAGIGYSTLGSQADPFGFLGIVGCVLVGCGQMGVILSVTGLLGQETPVDVRGSVIGLAGTCGALGILMTSLAGGYIFDHVSISGPILLVGLANFAVFAFALAVWLADGRPLHFNRADVRSAERVDLAH
jgi:MFS family permease